MTLDVPPLVFPRMRAYSSVCSAKWVCQKSSSDKTEGTKKSCCALKLGLDANNDDLDTVKEVESMSV
jgi:hypothetical protein